MAKESKAAKTAQPVTRETIGPENPAELLGCQDAQPEAEPDANPQAPADLPGDAPLEYAVTGCDRLNLRERPGLDAPVIVELPRGVGVCDTGRTDGDWWKVTTGRLAGWVMATYLEPVWS